MILKSTRKKLIRLTVIHRKLKDVILFLKLNNSLASFDKEINSKFLEIDNIVNSVLTDLDVLDKQSKELLNEVREKLIVMKNKIKSLKTSNLTLVNENNFLHTKEEISIDLENKLNNLKVYNLRLRNEYDLLNKENLKCKNILLEYNIKINNTKISSKSGFYNEVFKN